MAFKCVAKFFYAFTKKESAFSFQLFLLFLLYVRTDHDAGSNFLDGCKKYCGKTTHTSLKYNYSKAI